MCSIKSVWRKERCALVFVHCQKPIEHTKCHAHSFAIKTIGSCSKWFPGKAFGIYKWMGWIIAYLLVAFHQFIRRKKRSNKMVVKRRKRFISCPKDAIRRGCFTVIKISWSWNIFSLKSWFLSVFIRRQIYLFLSNIFLLWKLDQMHGYKKYYIFRKYWKYRIYCYLCGEKNK